MRKTDKATHTKKAVSHCSCFMNINVKSDGTVRARGCLAHVGHKVDPAQLRLTDAQRLMLKEMLEGRGFNKRDQLQTTEGLQYTILDVSHAV